MLLVENTLEFHEEINMGIGVNTVPLPLIAHAFTGHKQAVGSQNWEQLCFPCETAITSISTHCASTTLNLKCEKAYFGKRQQLPSQLSLPASS